MGLRTRRHRENRVLLVAGNRDSGSARIRLLQFVPSFRSAGLEVRTGEWAPAGYADFMGKLARLLWDSVWADVVVLQKPSQPRWAITAVSLLADLMVDVDDAIWIGSGGLETPASRRVGSRLRHAARRARWVVVGSQYLADELEREVPGVALQVIRPALPVAEYEQARLGVTRSVPPAIVWIGSAGNLSDLEGEFLRGVEPLICEGLASLSVISDHEGSVTDLLGIPVNQYPWSAEAEAELLAAATIGVMPLRDDPRSRGRCGFKAVQYMAAGVVTVASPVGASLELITEERTGMLALGADKWEGTLRRLLADASLRASLVNGARENVLPEHDLDGAAQRWVRLLGRTSQGAS